MKKKVVTSDKLRVSKSINFMNLGFKDYIGARTLLNNELNLQGAILASTSVEKYFKAIISLLGNECKGHLRKAHLNLIKSFDKKLFLSLNLSFLNFLMKIYVLRYFDSNLNQVYNIQILDKQFLAELDYTVFEINKRLKISKNEEKVGTYFDTYIEENNPLIIKNNYILQDIDKRKFIEQENAVYVLYSDNDFKLIEFHYKTLDINNDGDFMKQGILRNNS